MAIDQIKIGANALLKISQKGLPVSQEALFLLQFISHSGLIPRFKAIDLGCGSGVLTLGLSLLFPDIKIKGIELQPELARTSRFNCEQNDLNERVEIICGDIRDKHIRPAQHSCDFVIANPPFRRQHTGLISPNQLRRGANHELSASLEDFVQISSIALKHKGLLGMVMIPERLTETLTLLDKHKVPAVAIQWIHHDQRSEASAFLIIGRKGGRGGLKVFSPVFVK